MSKILSIIIPTYNMEALLPQCLDSLLVKQGRERLDVWVVNDGSKDRSSEIAHEYVEKYPDVFHVIDKENGNYGSCINAALPKIQGKYVKILDSDDSFETANLQVYLDKLEQTDVDLMITDYISVDADGHIKNRTSFDFQNNIQFPVTDIPVSKYIGMHAVTYRSGIFKEIDYHQTEGVSYTDVDWIFHPMVRVNKVCYMPIVIYRYLTERDGQTIDFETRLKRLGHIEKGLFNELNILYTLDGQCPVFERLTSMARGRVYGIYKLYLTNKHVNYDLQAFDDRLRREYPDIYQISDNYSLKTPISKKDVPFVHLWRKYHLSWRQYCVPIYLQYFIEKKIMRLKQKSC